MKLLSINKSFTVEKDYPGLMSMNLSCAVKSASDVTGSFAWNGPKLPREEWEQMLSFFYWTHSEHKSESQVRLYVNPIEGRWRIWAFPQEEGTGMAARTIENHPNVAAGLALFPDPWIWFGTGHHHREAPAFQSSTDLNDEMKTSSDPAAREAAAGLHFTIGHMDADVHDLHVRLCIPSMGLAIEPDMQSFWDTGIDESLVPHGVMNSIARWQMCKSSRVPFPQEWRDNVISRPKHFTPGVGNGLVSGSESFHRGYAECYVSKPFDSSEKHSVIGIARKMRIETAAEQIATFFKIDDAADMWKLVSHVRRLDGGLLINKNVTDTLIEYQVDQQEVADELAITAKEMDGQEDAVSLWNSGLEQ